MSDTINQLIHVSPGEDLSATLINAMIDRITALEAAAGGTGGAAAQQQVGNGAAGGGLGIARVLAALRPDMFIMVRIVNVNITGTPIGGTSKPSEVTYDITGIGRPGIVLTNQTPVLGRPVHGDEARIWPDSQGQVAFLLRSPAADGEGGIDAQFWILNEVVARMVCE